MKSYQQLVDDYLTNAKLVGDDSYYASAIFVCGFGDFKNFLAHVRRDALEAVLPMTNLIEWIADQPCTGNGSGMLCRLNSPDDPSYCCTPCKAHLVRYGAK